MIGSALVGTFMGVLLAYGIVAPLAGRLKQVLEQPTRQIYPRRSRRVITASLHGWPQPMVVERSAFGPGTRVPALALSEMLDALRGR